MFAKISSNGDNDNTNTAQDQVIRTSPSTVASTSLISSANKKSDSVTNSPSTNEHSIHIQIVPNLKQESSASAAVTAESLATLIDTKIQQSLNPPTDHFEQQNQMTSTNMNTYDVTIAHSNSSISDWTSNDTPNVPFPDDGLIYDDLLDDEDDVDDDLDIEDILEYDGEIPDSYPEDFY